MPRVIRGVANIVYHCIRRHWRHASICFVLSCLVFFWYVQRTWLVVSGRLFVCVLTSDLNPHKKNSTHCDWKVGRHNARFLSENLGTHICDTRDRNDSPISVYWTNTTHTHTHVERSNGGPEAHGFRATLFPSFFGGKYPTWSLDSLMMGGET